VLCCSPLDLFPLPGGSSGSSLARASGSFIRTCRRAPHGLRPIFEAPDDTRRASEVVADSFSSRLSWDSFSDVPLLRHGRCASTPSDVAAAFGPTGTTRRIAFRPRGFSPPRRFAPHPGFQACCIPVPERVRCVSVT
jgi:hypothetical protein